MNIPLNAAKQGKIGAGLPETLADMMNELYTLGSASHLNFVNDAVEKITGHSPRSLQQYAQDYVAAFK